MARILWSTVTLLTLTLFIAAVPVRFIQLISDATNYASALESFGLSPFFYALYFLLPEVATVGIFSFVAILIFRQKSDDWMVILFSLMLVTMGVVFTPILQPLSADNPLALRLSMLVSGLGVAAVLTFFYIFPNGRFVPGFTKYLALLWVGWALSWPLFPHAAWNPLGKGTLLSFGMMLVAYPIAIFSQFYRFFVHFSSEQRERTRWLIFGLAGAVLTWFVTMFLNDPIVALLPANVRLLYSLVGRPTLTYFPVLLVFLALAVSVFRYRIWDVDLLLNRGLVYSTLTALLGLIYFLIVLFLTLLVRTVFNVTNNTLAIFVATLTIAFAFRPLKQRVQASIDRALYRTKVDYQEVIQALGAELSSSIDLDQLNALLTRETPELLQIEHASLVVIEPGRKCLSTVGAEAHCLLSLSHPLMSYLSNYKRPISYFATPPDLPDEARNFMDVRQFILCIPLVVGDKVIGAYSLGNKLSGGVYSREEIQLLSMLGQQAAISVENARLYRQLQRYNVRLEEQVQRRTQELELAYRNLEEQHARLDVILQNVADALVVTDLQGRITLSNPAFESLMGSPSTIFVGHNLSEVFPDPALNAAIEVARESSPLVVTVDATWQEQVYRASACALTGSVYPVGGVVTILRDITKEVEVSNMKDDFVSMVSHELRTPMTSVLGFSKLIQKQFARYIEPSIDDARAQRAAKRVVDNLEIIVSEGERLTRLINDVLDIAKMESGGVEWDKGDVVLPDLIQASVASINSLARQKRLPVVVKVPERVPMLYGDHDRLVQVLTNLLSNAIKFTDEGRVEVHARILQAGDVFYRWEAENCPERDVALQADKELVAISVTDTGVGIADSDLPKIFEKFRQVGSKSDGTRRPGTGLGLPICREIIEHHGGKIWAESRLGEGSRLTFTLPVYNSQTPPSELLNV